MMILGEGSFEHEERRADRRRGITIDTFGDMAIIVPCYNEAERLDTAAFEAFMNRYKDISFIFVNDGSSDATGPMLDDFTSKFRRQTAVLHMPCNGGKAEAVRQGMTAAIARGFRFVGYWDADLATCLSAILEFGTLIRRDGNHTVVIGARLRLLGHQIERDPSRRLFSRAFNLVARLALRLNIRDTQCGAKLFEVDGDLVAALAHPFEASWLFDIELLQRLIARKGRRDFIYEHALFSWSEIAGSKVSMRKSLKAVAQLCFIGVRGARL